MTSDIALSGAACTLDVMPRQLVRSSSENDSRKRAVSLCADAVASVALGRPCKSASNGPVQACHKRRTVLSSTSRISL